MTISMIVAINPSLYFCHFSPFFFFNPSAAYSKRGEEFFAQLADLAATCRNLMADFRGKLAQEEMLSHNVHPNKR